jgi:hypothetical protein
MQSELLLAKARDEVIEKNLVTKQAAVLLIALRQQILNLPQSFTRRFVGLTDVNQASTILREMSIGVLESIKDLPSKITNPHWLEELENDGDKQQ